MTCVLSDYELGMQKQEHGTNLTFPMSHFVPSSAANNIQG